MPRNVKEGNKQANGLAPTFSQLLSLPDDVLYVIFSKCDIQTLGRLCRSCRRMNNLLQSDSAWLKYSKNFFIIHADNIVNEPKKKSLKEEFRISLNWASKYCRERMLLRYSPRQIPWIQYADQTLWISTKNIIKCYNVQGKGFVRENKERNLNLQTTDSSEACDDVSKFVVKNNMAVSGCRDGSLYVFDCNSGKCLIRYNKVHNTDAQAVDFNDTCIVSGSRDRTVKIISSNIDLDSTENTRSSGASIDVGDRVWSLAISPAGQYFTVGTAGCHGADPLSMWDIESGKKIFTLGEYRNGAGILDMKYETVHTLLTCGYDANLRMWDTRSGKRVLQWEEPFDTTLYCLQTDRDVAMVTGTARYGMVRLWDKRQIKPVQMYYMGPKNSPVYSLGFDSSRLYAAHDLSIVMTDFSIMPP